MADTGHRVVLVAGASGALGQAVAERFRDDGWTVAGLARPDSLDRIPAGVTRIACDLRVTAEVQAAAAQVASLGRLTALVVASGGFATGRAVDLTDEQIHDQLELNLLGPWRIARAAAAAMRAGGAGGSIVVTLSRASVEVTSGAAAYQVTKAGGARLVEVMARELRSDGIRVNAVLPSVIDTPSNRESMGEANSEKWVPAPRIATLIAWLCSGDAGDISGALVPVYGRA